MNERTANGQVFDLRNRTDLRVPASALCAYRSDPMNAATAWSRSHADAIIHMIDEVLVDDLIPHLPDYSAETVEEPEPVAV